MLKIFFPELGICSLDKIAFCITVKFDLFAILSAIFAIGSTAMTLIPEFTPPPEVGWIGD